MAFPPLPVLRRALRRSRLRGAVLLALDELGEASALDVALRLGADVRNVEGALLGDDVRYRRSGALVRMLLATSRDVAGERLFVLTDEGRAAAVWVRRELERVVVPGVILRVV